MQLQSSPISIVRSIRQVSLARDWIRARGGKGLPSITSFEPDVRAGDALDLSIYQIDLAQQRAGYICLKAGDRVRAIHGEAMTGRALHECLPAPMAAAAAPIWDACIATRLPVYSIIPVKDREGLPVTIEQILLPYSRGDAEPAFIVTSLHAWSTEGRFLFEGLLRSQDRVPAHWAVVLDPDSKNSAAATKAGGTETPAAVEDVS